MHDKMLIWNNSKVYTKSMDLGGQLDRGKLEPNVSKNYYFNFIYFLQFSNFLEIHF